MSKTQSTWPPTKLSKFFLDRSYGGKRVATLLRDAGIELETLEEVYGVQESQSTKDIEWLEYAGLNKFPVLTRDKKIRSRELEKTAIIDYSNRVFCLTGKNLKAEELANRIIDNIGAIHRACQQPGPFFYSVSSNRITRLL